MDDQPTDLAMHAQTQDSCHQQIRPDILETIIELILLKKNFPCYQKCSVL